MFCMSVMVLPMIAQISKEFRNKVAEINKILPTSIGETTIEEMKIENGFIVMYVSRTSMYDEEGKSTQRSYGEAFLEQAKNESVRVMYQDFLNEGLGVKMVGVFKDTGERETLTFTVDELQRMMSFPASAYSELLHDIRISRKSLPISAGDGMTCVAYEFPQKESLLVYEVDEDLYPIDILQKNLNKNKFKLLAELVDGSSELFPFVKLCVNAGYGFGMKYVGKSSKREAEMIIPYEDLKSCLE